MLLDFKFDYEVVALVAREKGITAVFLQKPKQLKHYKLNSSNSFLLVKCKY